MANKTRTSKSKTTGKQSVKAPIIAGAVALAVAGGAGGYVYRASTESDDVVYYSAEMPTPEYTVSKYRLRKAKQDLSALEIRKTDTAPVEYDKSLVPNGWADVDNNGCQTRYDVLFENLAGLVNGEKSCSVESGSLFDYYSGQVITYDHTISGGGIDIDHVVAKENAWNSGGYSWTTDQWEEYVNDKSVLLAVSATENRSKGGKDAAEWLVPNNPDFRCRYVIMQINIKKNYGLSVRSAEKAAIENVLSTECETK